MSITAKLVFTKHVFVCHCDEGHMSITMHFTVWFRVHSLRQRLVVRRKMWTLFILMCQEGFAVRRHGGAPHCHSMFLSTPISCSNNLIEYLCNRLNKKSQNWSFTRRKNYIWQHDQVLFFVFSPKILVLQWCRLLIPNTQDGSAHIHEF